MDISHVQGGSGWRCEDQMGCLVGSRAVDSDIVNVGSDWEE